MKQVTLRLDDDLAADLTADAARLGRSVNAHAALGLRALVDPDAEGEEIERIRARLRRAGLLAEHGPPVRRRPPAELVAQAGKAAGRGKSLSDIVSEDRGPR